MDISSWSLHSFFQRLAPTLIDIFPVVWRTFMAYMHWIHICQLVHLQMLSWQVSLLVLSVIHWWIPFGWSRLWCNYLFMLEPDNRIINLAAIPGWVVAAANTMTRVAMVSSLPILITTPSAMILVKWKWGVLCPDTCQWNLLKFCLHQALNAEGTSF